MTHLSQITRTVAAAALIGAITVASMIAPAQASGKTGAEQRARQVCESVIRVQPGESQFDGCVSSLAESLENVSRNRAVTEARDACFAQKPGSVDLNLCLLRATDAKPSSDAIELPDTASVATGIADDPRSSESYFVVSSRIKFRREQQACALLGLDPASGAFATCVANLQGTLQYLDAPDI